MATKILRLPDVKARTGLSRSTIYLRVSQKKFPGPIPLGGRAVGWLDSDVEGWLEEQVRVARDFEDHVKGSKREPKVPQP